jgi:hypothetical protein
MTLGERPTRGLVDVSLFQMVEVRLGRHRRGESPSRSSTSRGVWSSRGSSRPLTVSLPETGIHLGLSSAARAATCDSWSAARPPGPRVACGARNPARAYARAHENAPPGWPRGDGGAHLGDQGIHETTIMARGERSMFASDATPPNLVSLRAATAWADPQALGHLTKA